MNPRAVTTVVDAKKCIGCGACIRVCPSQTLTMKNKTAHVTGDKSLSCGHCEAVCPSAAIKVQALAPEMMLFASFNLDREWMSHGGMAPGKLAQLMASRRSCRNFKKTQVPADVLWDLIKFGCLAPSGTNSQEWTYTCLKDREAVLTLGAMVMNFFKGINQKAENTLLRKGLKLVGQNALDAYYEEYYESVKEAIDLMENHDQDRLFHGATACILVGSTPEASCPKEDALLAAGNILLGAHALGLGTCLIGFAVEAMKADKSIQERLDIPSRERVHAVIALGYPDETYEQVAGRKKPMTRFI